MAAIKLENVSKKFGNTLALNNVNLAIEPNKIYGLLGRNGAGKTTLLNLVTNKIFQDQGTVTINGEPVYENEKMLNKVFYMVEEDLYPEHLKVKQIFSWTKVFYSKMDFDYANALAQKFGLDTNKKVKQLSTGYNSIFKAIVALASNAEIIIFDEPILGLDANHRDLFYKELIKNYSNHPKTIIISTHLIEEVSDVLEEAIVIKEGEIILKQSVEELLSSAYKVSGESEKVNQYIEGKEVIGEETMGQYKEVTLLESSKKKNETLAKDLNLEFGKVELQKLFINLTNA
ncbi:ABC-2 type transport system ATP-binding protein [Natranaerovirga hydrolytica]|uniref:ABC-2 type transport system ATP-binding protein n=1 Tax=Natranaerovirga hydrolytica TaxID=680378 RepID=A0A4R1MZ58_9FIRM|nr:ABC transporter ATP-binding protein [Natranaerovirga hydrolytica]TCK98607.1 ABC-2 type transport system ATP-binding protein [Natranaerovirga hydrolytica]